MNFFTNFGSVNAEGEYNFYLMNVYRMTSSNNL